MVFRLLLWIMALRIHYLGKHNAGFKQFIHRYENVVLQFRTQDNAIKRYYQFQSGSTFSEAKLHPNATMGFVFKDAKQALALIKKMGENPEDKTLFIYAIRDGILQVEGDMAYMTWFQVLGNYLPPERKKPVKPHQPLSRHS